MTTEPNTEAEAAPDSLEEAFVVDRESGKAQAIIDAGMEANPLPVLEEAGDGFTDELREKQAKMAAFFVTARDARVAEKTRAQIEAMCEALARNAAQEWIGRLMEGEQTIKVLGAEAAERPLVLYIGEDFQDRAAKMGYSIYPKVAIEVLDDGDAGFAYFTYWLDEAPNYDRKHKVSITPSACRSAEEAAMVATVAFCDAIEAEITSNRAARR